MRPLRWLAHLPIALLPLLAAVVIEGPRFQHALHQEVEARLAAADAGWAQVTVWGRDVMLQGAAPSAAQRAAARDVAAGTPGVRLITPHGEWRVLEDPLNFTGTLTVLLQHWFWMLVAAGLGAWVGWRMAAEPGAAPPAASATVPAAEEAA